MIKNLITTAIGLTLSSFSMAATFAPNADSGIAIVNADAAGCSLLSEGVRVSMSKGVAGGYECDDETNQIAVSFCHPNGKKTGGTNNFFYSMTSAGGKTHITDDEPCAAETAATKAATLAGVELDEPDPVAPDPDTP